MSESVKDYEVIVLFDGFSEETEIGTLANCSCTLIKGPKNIIVDTLTAWDGSKLVAALAKEDITCDSIDYVVCTHGHSDHIGCNYLFQKAIHIVGFCISQQEIYMSHDFKSDKEFIIDDCVKVIPTPGHTLQHVSVLVKNENYGTIAVTGDLFENEDDLEDDDIWKSAGSDSTELQILNRQRILSIADWIVPGHGPMFKVKKEVSKDI